MKRYYITIILAALLTACGNGLDRSADPGLANTPVVINCPVWIVNTVTQTVDCWYGEIVNATGYTVAQQ